MSANDESKRKEDVLSLLRKTDGVHQELYADTQNLLSDVRLARDVGEVVTEIIEGIPRDDTLSNQDWTQIEANSRAQYEAARQMLSTLGNTRYFSLTTSTTSASTAVLSFSLDNFGQLASAPLFREAKQEMLNILNRQPLVDDVRARLMSLQLDERRGSIRSALELMDDAVAAFQRPSGSDASPIAVLLHMREAFNVVIDELLKRRPNQEVTRSTEDKLESIGQQCGQRGLPSDHFTRLGMSCSNLLNQLSGTKHRAMPRKDIEVAFNGGLQLLKSLLDSLDPERFQNAVVPIRRSGA